MYYERIIDRHLKEWAERPVHKPVLLRGARQVGKSTAVRHGQDVQILRGDKPRKTTQLFRAV